MMLKIITIRSFTIFQQEWTPTNFSYGPCHGQTFCRSAVNILNNAGSLAGYMYNSMTPRITLTHLKSKQIVIVLQIITEAIHSCNMCYFVLCCLCTFIIINNIVRTLLATFSSGDQLAIKSCMSYASSYYSFCPQESAQN